MGTFQIAFDIGDSSGRAWETVEALVDTGSSTNSQFINPLFPHPVSADVFSHLFS